MNTRLAYLQTSKQRQKEIKAFLKKIKKGKNIDELFHDAHEEVGFVCADRFRTVQVTVIVEDDDSEKSDRACRVECAIAFESAPRGVRIGHGHAHTVTSGCTMVRGRCTSTMAPGAGHGFPFATNARAECMYGASTKFMR